MESATTVAEGGFERELPPRDGVTSPDQGRQFKSLLPQGQLVSAAAQESEAASSARATRGFARAALMTLVVTEIAWFSFLAYLAVQAL